jgi:murein endopeptidase
MAVIYDHAVTDARRRVERHQPVYGRHSKGCTAGCAQWPCQPFSLAWAVVTHNSNRRSGR